jgi:hypothetical protein
MQHSLVSEKVGTVGFAGYDSGDKLLRSGVSWQIKHHTNLASNLEIVRLVFS